METRRNGDDPGGAAVDLLAAVRSRGPIRGRVRLGVGAVVVLAILALVVAVVIAIARGGGTASVVPSVSLTATRDPSSPTGAGARATPSAVYVHVLGAVAAPGLYPLSAGARVVDAIAAAGGFTDEANPAGVNLARPVADGEQLRVPTQGEEVSDAAAPGVGPGADGAPAAGAKVNLNSATSEQLQTLPRVGPALAGRILAWRAANGRFASVDDLLNVSGIGEKTIEALRDLVTT
jgi:competence protein ComEA